MAAVDEPSAEAAAVDEPSESKDAAAFPEASDDEVTEVEEVHSPMSIARFLICCRICQLECLL